MKIDMILVKILFFKEILTIKEKRRGKKDLV